MACTEMSFSLPSTVAGMFPGKPERRLQARYNFLSASLVISRICQWLAYYQYGTSVFAPSKSLLILVSIVPLVAVQAHAVTLDTCLALTSTITLDCSLAVLHCHVLLKRRALDFFSRQRSQALGVRRRGGRSGDGGIDSCASWTGLFLILIRWGKTKLFS